MAAPIVIVGAGMAGGRAAQMLARRSDERIVLVGDEPHMPYNRPELSKGFLAGTVGLADLTMRPMPEEVEHRAATRAVGLNPDAHRLALADGSTLDYSKLLIATGGVPRRLDVPGADLEGVHYLRTVQDAHALRSALHESRRVVIVGAGLVGQEVACTSRALGIEVDFVDIAAPFAALGDSVSKVITTLHEDAGARFHIGTSVRTIDGTDRVRSVTLVDGTVLPAETVVVGVGITPALGWLGDLCTGPAPLPVDNRGATSIADVYAVGDACTWPHPYFGRLHTEHESIAQNQGMQVALAIAGRGGSVAGLPYAWSDQGAHQVRMIGVPTSDGVDDIVDIVGPAAGRAFLYLRGGEVVGGVSIDWTAFTSELQRQMRELPLAMTPALLRTLSQ